MRWTLLLTLALAVAGAVSAAHPDQHRRDIEQWRRERVDRLLHSQTGWLALVGLHWFEPGTHQVGRAKDNGIVLNTGPDTLGTLTLADKKVRFVPAEGTNLTIVGMGAPESFEMVADSAGSPTVVAFDNGAATMQVIERNGRFALRVRDARARPRMAFEGIESYDIDAGWRFDASYEAHPPGRTIQIANVLGHMDAMANPGAVVFERDGKKYRIEVVDEGDGQLFLIFADRTNGKETYGAGRFLYAAAPVEGRTVVDFNKAYNPPCAFSSFSTCPLPPPENRLDLAVTAGEKKYTGPTQ